ncbi:hypothetical protein CHUAL_001132 [Chamberlinius hualienensis]
MFLSKSDSINDYPVQIIMSTWTTATCISKLEEELVAQLRHWIIDDADFYGNTNETFMLWFIRGCKYDLDKTKKKMRKYYENRVKFPQH